MLPDRPLRILLLEDDPDDAAMVERALAKGRLQLDLHRISDLAALERALQAGGWDLVISDFCLPDCDGTEALARVRAADADLPFLLVSGTVGEELAAAAMRGGAQDYLLKDNLSRLALAVEREVGEYGMRLRRRRLEGALRAVLRGTAAHTGEGFLRSLVEQVARGLGTRNAVIATYPDLATGDLCTIAWWVDGGIAGNISIPATGSVFNELRHRHTLLVRERLAERFPASGHGPTAGMVSFFGMALTAADGHSLGLLAVLDDRPLGDDALDQDVLAIFAARAGAELERLQAEAARLSLEAQLRHTQKLEALGTLAGGIAHDFNNLLTGIYGHAQLLSRRLDAEAPGHTNLHGILSGCKRASELVSRILAFGRRQELRIQPMDLAEVCQEAGRLLRATLPSTIALQIDVPSSLPTVRGDPAQLHQVVLNLATNAYQAMGQGGGRLMLSLSTVHLTTAQAAGQPPLHPGLHVQLRVIDSGCGMDPETLARIFEPFYTTKSAGEGTGLGLSVVHGIITSHSGTIHVDSQPGVGTTFTILLPASMAAVQVAMPTPLGTRIGTGETILVVDDEPDVARILRDLLDHLGYQPTVVHHPDAALQLVADAPQAFRLVITDFTMPGMTGDRLLELLKALRPDLPVILTSGYTADGGVNAMQRHPGTLVLAKPYTIERLATVVREALGNA